MNADERDDTPAETAALERAEPESALDSMLADARAEAAAPLLPLPGVTSSLVGEVVDDRHPALRGRVRVRWADLEGQRFEKWLPTLQGLPVRVADRVILVQPSNWPELVVMGVLDGFERRPEVPRSVRASLVLERDEAIRVESKSGQELLELREEESGPVVRLLTGDVDLDIPGQMRVRAGAITLEATKGQARIEASDDVVVKGEIVRLN